MSERMPPHRTDWSATGWWAAASQLSGHSDLDRAQSLASQLRRVGKQHLDHALLGQLVTLRDQLDGSSWLHTFLDCVLDKHEGRYHYTSYLALPLVERLRRAGSWSAWELADLLVADAVRFEITAASEDASTGRPRPAALRRRVRHGLRFLLRPRSDRPSMPLPALRQDDLSHLLELLPEAPDDALRTMLDATVLPVHTRHDEYLFIRVLQSQELIFSAILERLRVATDLISEEPSEAARHLREAAVAFHDSRSLIRMLATMDIPGFREFRTFTEGSSAIQSATYKEIEVLCGKPRRSRIDSPAFTNVPEVRQRAVAPTVTSFSEKYLRARHAQRLHTSERAAIDHAVDCLEQSHQHWKLAHYSLAERFLGDTSGSGYTAGVPYLRACLDNRLFWRLDHPTTGELDG